MPVHPLDCDEKITFNMCQSLSKTHSNCLYNKLKHICKLLKEFKSPQVLNTDLRTQSNDSLR